MSDRVEDNTAGHDAIREDVRRLLAGRPMTVAAKEMDVAYGTFSAWMGGTYSGNNVRIAEAAVRWIEAQATKVAVRAAAAHVPEYQQTKTSAAFMSALQAAQYEPNFVLVCGGAGVGKSTSIEEYKRRNPNVFVVTGEPCFSTPKLMMDAIAEELDLTERYSSHSLSRAIRLRLRNSGGLLVIDEAQHMSSLSLDQLRTFFDKADVGVAMVGNDTVYARVEGHGRQAHFAQLFSRIGARVSRPMPYEADIVQMIDAWGVTGSEERAALKRIGNMPGALRNITKVLKRAHMMAEGTPVTAAIISRAWQSISGTKLVMLEAA
jgi:DNA transposition AAA+ family ATPase